LIAPRRHLCVLPPSAEARPSPSVSQRVVPGRPDGLSAGPPDFLIPLPVRSVRRPRLFRSCHLSSAGPRLVHARMPHTFHPLPPGLSKTPVSFPTARPRSAAAGCGLSPSPTRRGSLASGGSHGVPPRRAGDQTKSVVVPDCSVWGRERIASGRTRGRGAGTRGCRPARGSTSRPNNLAGIHVLFRTPIAIGSVRGISSGGRVVIGVSAERLPTAGVSSVTPDGSGRLRDGGVVPVGFGPDATLAGRSRHAHARRGSPRYPGKAVRTSGDFGRNFMTSASYCPSIC
jgi:hypothetical protein